MRRMMLACGLGFCIPGILYAIDANFGYLTFLACTRDNILDNYDPTLPFVPYVLLAYLCVVVLSFPVIMFPARESIVNILTVCVPSMSKYPVLSRLVIGFALVWASFGLGALSNKISVVFGLVGATAGTCIMYVLPGIFYYKLRNRELGSHRHRGWDGGRTMAVISIVGGIIVGVAATAVLAYDMAVGASKPEPGCDMKN